MQPAVTRGIALNRPASPPIRLSFGLFWLVDLVATVFLFLVPYATELNPITTHFYNLIGLPGVVLAGSIYAVAVVMIGHYLPKPYDALFAVGAVLVYAVCASNNVILLMSGEPVVETLILSL
ncbi:hypothetical protein [Natrinema longum]|uniref:DUF5658 domain-containing protein n=1 Tax=Natrinema longum TaxID=370324 RepID=A0A8A2UD49_9EURY|nr:hypothetical protein [Natrinema longum]MBZ6494344.1 hypothetical protein [Natrinema longum]MBZ6495635.1 hypothetical protein [Natrinema longum]QSW84333.1 hypothetical protein J0X27_12835 [Natrinema longum]QSW86402.1 hypothetical protein J0X27_06180 [Natrinema longum]